MTSEFIAKVCKHVEPRLSHEASGHDWNHTRRVWHMARHLQSKEGGDLELIELAALLHCAAEHDLRSKRNEQSRIYTLMGICDVLDIHGALRDNIIQIANWSHYKGHDTGRPVTIEGKIVQDATFLETLGALGVARAFTAGGYLGRTMYDPRVKPLKILNNEAYQTRKLTGTTINYFYEKPFQIIKIINTQTARKIAARRLAFTQNFLEEFIKEWNVKDV